MSETTEVNRAAFGQFLNQLRREKGWTQKDLAERLYVSDKAVSKWERGLSLPDVALLLPLAGAAGRVGDRAAWRAAGCRAGAAVYSARRSGGAHSKGADVPGGAARAPDRARVTEVSARVSHLQRAGHGRGIGCLGF